MFDGLVVVHEHPWLMVGLVMMLFMGLLAALSTYRASRAPHPEHVRKLLHVGSGLITLSFPFLFRTTWPVLFLTGWAATVLLLPRIVRTSRGHAGGVLRGIGRASIGEFCFPISVAAVFWLSRHEPTVFYIVPILVLTVADAASALVGVRYPFTPYSHGRKTLEGSMAFLLASFVCIYGPLMLWGGRSGQGPLLVAATAAVILTLVEARARGGLDNLLVPLTAFFLVRALLAIDADAQRLSFFASFAIAGVTLAFLVGRKRFGSARMCTAAAATRCRPGDPRLSPEEGVSA